MAMDSRLGRRMGRRWANHRIRSFAMIARRKATYQKATSIVLISKKQERSYAFTDKIASNINCEIIDSFYCRT